LAKRTKVKVDTRDVKKFRDDLLRSAKKKIPNNLGRFLVSQIKKITRAGFQMQHKGGRSKFATLKNDTVVNRIKLSEWNNTHKLYAPARSNLTFSGQLLDALTFKYDKGNQKLEIFVDDTQREPYITGSIGFTGDDISAPTSEARYVSNADVSKGLADQGRNFVAIDKELDKQLANRLLKILNRELIRLRRKGKL
jgi:hypothetical protein